MNIAMFTNTFTPHVGGVARSVEAFACAYRSRGHRVLVVAPEVDGRPDHEVGVVRVPALQHFNGSDFVVPLPVPGWLRSALVDFEPDVVHAHHPFLLGDTALRVASAWTVPVVFTHHTQYEKYTHYVPGDSDALKTFVRDVALGYANLADAVIAPSRSIADLLGEAGVTVRIAVIPTGFDPAVFHSGPGGATRHRLHIPPAAFVIGHVGRLAPEKNLDFLVRAVLHAMRRRPHAHLLLVGDGPSAAGLQAAAQRAGLASRVRMTGVLLGGELAEAYRAMDAFAFASQTETQGMVVTEALATGIPVVALDAPGVREVVRDGVNGRLLAPLDERGFTRALLQSIDLPGATQGALRRAAADSVGAFTIERTADLALELYGSLRRVRRAGTPAPDSLLERTLRRIKRELAILMNLAEAAGAAVVDEMGRREIL